MHCRAPCHARSSCGSYSRVSQEEVGPDLVDVAHRGRSANPQQALQGGQGGWLVRGQPPCLVDPGPAEVLLLH